MEHIIYSTGLLPKGASVAQSLTNRLNDRGLKPKRKESYTANIVKNALSGKLADDNVKREIYRWVLENNTLDEVQVKIKNVKGEYTAMQAEIIQMCAELSATKNPA